jgi:hypothetical protein
MRRGLTFQRRDSRLPEVVYGYLNNPLLQESLSLIPLATCFDYAADPAAYDPERNWREAIRELFGRSERAVARPSPRRPPAVR